MEDKRFSCSAGSEYALAQEAIPHDTQLQQAVGRIVAAIHSPCRVLEIGCGSGSTTQQLIRDDVSIDALDNESVMLSQAQETLSEYINSGAVTLLEDDALAFLRVCPSNTYDIVASVFTLHNFDQDYRLDVHVEILRVLKPNGVFVNGDKYARKEPDHQQDLNWQLEQFQKVFSSHNRQDLIDVWTAHYLEDEHPDTIMKEQDTVIELEEVGFVDVQVNNRMHMEAILTAKKRQ